MPGRFPGFGSPAGGFDPAPPPGASLRFEQSHPEACLSKSESRVPALDSSVRFRELRIFEFGLGLLCSKTEKVQVSYSGALGPHDYNTPYLD